MTSCDLHKKMYSRWFYRVEKVISTEQWNKAHLIIAINRIHNVCMNESFQRNTWNCISQSSCEHVANNLYNFVRKPPQIDHKNSLKTTDWNVKWNEKSQLACVQNSSSSRLWAWASTDWGWVHTVTAEKVVTARRLLSASARARASFIYRARENFPLSFVLFLFLSLCQGGEQWKQAAKLDKPVYRFRN